MKSYSALTYQLIHLYISWYISWYSFLWRDCPIL
jgi:hypothetical protein